MNFNIKDSLNEKGKMIMGFQLSSSKLGFFQGSMGRYLFFSNISQGKFHGIYHFDTYMEALVSKKTIQNKTLVIPDINGNETEHEISDLTIQSYRYDLDGYMQNSKEYFY